MSDKTCGPAFPITHVPMRWTKDSQGNNKFVEGFHGKEVMTLRDYFASKAMQSMVGLWSSSSYLNEVFIAEKAYQMASAMLKQREMC